MCLASCTQHNVFEVQLYCCFSPFCCQIVFHCMDIGMHFICPVGGHLGSPAFGLLGSPLLWTFATSLCLDICFQLSWENIWSGISRSYSKFCLFVFGHLVNLWLAFLKIAQMFSKVATPLFNPTSSAWGIQFVHFPPTLVTV